MTLTMLKSKIHRALVTGADLNYVGSITIDSSLMDASGIVEYEKVQVVNVTNGSRIETYAIRGEAGSGVICMNGAAARCACVGDVVIIMAYAQMDEEEAKLHKPTVVLTGRDNCVEKIISCEKHGEIL